MNLILFSLVFIVLTFPFPISFGEVTPVIDILPDFIGYLILWYMLEKRRFNRRMNGVYTAVSVLTGVSFLFFLSQIMFLFPDFFNGDGMILGWLLTGMAFLLANFGDLVLLIAILAVGSLLFALLGYWEQTNKHKLQCNLCRVGMVLCGIIALCYVTSTFFLTLPFSWYWITYPLSLLVIGCVYATGKGCPEMMDGVREPYSKERKEGPLDK